MKRKLLIIGSLGIILLSLIPFETVVVPPWDVRVLDSEQQPISGIKVEEVCQHYTYFEENLCAPFPDAVQVTDMYGMVRFPPRSIKLSSLSRAARAIKAYLLWFAHGSVGIQAYLLLTPPDGFLEMLPVEYQVGRPPQNVVILKRP